MSFRNRVIVPALLGLLAGALLACGCGQADRSQVERALVGRGRVVVVGEGSWHELRPSGTEPLLRNYAEAASENIVRNVLSRTESFVRGL